jgi:hypothetical protein
MAGPLNPDVHGSHRRATPTHGALELAQCTAVAVDRDHFTGGTDELSQRERERARSRSEIGPCPTARNSVPQEANVVRVIH